MADIDISEFRFSILQADYSVIDGHWTLAFPRMDPFSRLYYFDKGSALIEREGHEQTLKAGNLYLLPERLRFRHIPSDGAGHYWIHFVTKDIVGMSLFEVFNYNWTIPEKMHPRAYEYTKRLIEIFSENSPSACMEKQALLRFLLAPFITGVRSDVGRDEMIEHERFHDALTMIEERLEDPLTVEMLADSAHLHPNYFSNLFSERFGMSPLQYILKKRIERAQILLWSSSEPVKSISIKSGYDDPCYFSRIFKKHTGMTPLQYRKSLEVSS